MKYLGTFFECSYTIFNLNNLLQISEETVDVHETCLHCKSIMSFVYIKYSHKLIDNAKIPPIV